MISDEVFMLLKNREITFKTLLSISIGQVVLNSFNFDNILGKYSNYDLNLKDGYLLIDNDRKFNVQLIGSLSSNDNYWYSSECEKNISDEQVTLEISTRKKLESLNLLDYTATKYNLLNKSHGKSIAIIHSAFCPTNNILYSITNQPYTLFLYVKEDVADVVIRQRTTITTDTFLNVISHIINNYNINDKLMLQAFCKYLNYSYDYSEIGNIMIVKLNSKDIISFKFDKDNLIEHNLNNVNYQYPQITRDKDQEISYLCLDIKASLDIIKGIMISDEIFYKDPPISYAKSYILKLYKYYDADLTLLDNLDGLINLCSHERYELFNSFYKDTIGTYNTYWIDCVLLIKTKCVALKNLLAKNR